MVSKELTLREQKLSKNNKSIIFLQQPVALAERRCPEFIYQLEQLTYIPI